MKTLKFDKSLVPLVLSGEKTSTWRIDDDKDLQVGDLISCVHAGTKEEFAQVRVTSCRCTTFDRLTSEDLVGHEPFRSEEQMLQTYGRYYNKKVSPDTALKIVRFALIN